MKGEEIGELVAELENEIVLVQEEEIVTLQDSQRKVSKQWKIN